MNRLNSKNESQLYLSLVRDTLHHPYHSVTTPLHHCSENSYCALWLQSGRIEINNKAHEAGHGVDFAATDVITSLTAELVAMLRFIVSKTGLSESSATTDAYHCETIFTQKINATSNTLLLRLDQVDFPAGAVAYRHTHPGPGIRYLVDGGLMLESDHGEQIIKPGDAWFEGENCPVMATAISTMPSRFVRTMLLPLEFEGRSTFTLQNQSDARKPRLQSNIRHFEKRIVLSDLH